MTKHLRLSAALALVALFSAGCIFDKPAEPNKTLPTLQPQPPVPPDPLTPEPGPTPATAPLPPAPTPATTAKPALTPVTAPKPAPTPTPAAGAEANVIKGVVRDEQGDPVPGARIRIVGYTGNPTGLVGADHDDNVITDGSGAYRVQVPSGLYEINGEATVVFEGKSFVFYLHPADNNCDQQMSAPGIIRDFVLRLTGLKKCSGDDVDPNNDFSYSGGAIVLLYAQPRSLPDATQVTLVFTPSGQLADGSAGRPVTFTRTAGALQNTAPGPLEGTQALPDIPLGRYQLSGYATLGNGTRQDVRFAPPGTSTLAPSYTIDFQPRRTEGIASIRIDMYDTGASTPDPSPPTTTVTGPVCNPNWGCL